MDKEDILIDVQVNGIDQVTGLSNAIRVMNASLADSINVAKNMDAQQRGLSNALGITNRGMSDHAKTIGQAISNQNALGTEIRRVSVDIDKFSKGIGNNSRSSDENIKSLTNYKTALQSIKPRVLVEDLKSIALAMRASGKDLQFTGRNLMIGITAPIMGLVRIALGEIVNVDQAMTRLGQVVENIARDTDQAYQKLGISAQQATAQQKALAESMVREYDRVSAAIEGMSKAYGDSRTLLTAITGDFSELGLASNDSALALTNLTAQAEKIGNIDITAAKNLVQNIYFQANTTLQQNAAARGKVLSSIDAEAQAVKIAGSQLALFNAIENSTAVSMNDLASAMPEVASTTQEFGISMSETAGMLSAMKAAGFDAVSGAVALRTALQKLNDPSTKTTKLFGKLSKMTGYDFSSATHIGIQSIDALTQAYHKLNYSTKYAQEGTLELFTTTFGTRQGSKMTALIQDLDRFNQALVTSGTVENQVIAVANKAVKLSGSSVVPTIKSFSDIGAIARIATADLQAAESGVTQYVETVDKTGKQTKIAISAADIKAAQSVREAVGQMITESEKSGDSLLKKISSQYGRSMVVELGGVKSASSQADSELKTSLSSLKTQMDRFRVQWKNFLANLFQSIAPMVQKIIGFAEKLFNAFKHLSPAFKQFIVGFALAAAAIGPLLFAFGQAKLLISTFSSAILSVLPGMRNLTAAMVANNEAMLFMRNPLITTGEGFTTAASKFEILIAKLASGNGIIATVAKKFGLATGSLKTFQTASTEASASVAAVNAGAAGTLRRHGLFRGMRGLRSLDQTGQAAINPLTVQTPAAAAAEAVAGETMYASAYGDVMKQAGATKYRMGQYRAFHGIRRPDMAARVAAKEAALTAEADAAAAAENVAAYGAAYAAPAGELSRFARMRGGISRALTGFRDRGGLRGAFSRFRDRGIRGNLTAGPKKLWSAFKGAGEGEEASLMGRAVGGVRNLGGKGLSFVAAPFKAAKGAASAMFAGFAQGGTVISKLGGGIMGLWKHLRETFKIGELVKKALMMTAVLAVIVLIVGAIKMVVDTIKAGGPAMEKVKKTFGEAFGYIKSAFMALIKPFKDAFYTIMKLMGGGGDGGGGGGGVAGGMQKLADVVKTVAKAISSFVNGVLVPLLKTFLSNVIKTIQGIVKFVQGIVELFKGHWGKGFKLILQAAVMFGRVIISTFFMIVKLFVRVWEYGANGILTIFFKLAGALPKIMGAAIEKVAGFIADLVGWIPFIGGSLADGIRSVGKTVASAADWIGNGIENTIGGAIKHGVTAVADGAITVIDNLNGKIGNTLKLADSAVEKGKGQFVFRAKKVGTAAGETMAQGMSDGVNNGIQELAGGGGGGGSKKDVLQELAQKFIDAVLGNVKTGIDKVVSDIQEALQKQKEQALEVFDKQIENIDKLQKAEESLTKTIQYETERRKIIEDRALQVENYQRSRALAIYEGRIDDARVLSLEEQKNAIDFNTNLKNIDDSRRKDLAQENLDALRESINKAKDAAGKFFDEQLKNYEEVVKKITQFPPQTIEEYKAQLGKLNDAAKGVAAKNTAEINKIVGDMTATIMNNLPNKGIGVFTTSIDTLVSEAQKRYGMAATGIAALTVQMVKNVELGFQPINDKVLIPTLNKIDETLKKNNPFKTFADAVKDANTTIRQEFERTVKSVGFKMKGLTDQIDGVLKKYALADQKGGGGGGTGGTGGTGTGTGFDFVGKPGSIKEMYLGGGARQRRKGQRLISSQAGEAAREGNFDAEISNWLIRNRIGSLENMPGVPWYAKTTPKFKGSTIDQVPSYAPWYAGGRMGDLKHGGVKFDGKYVTSEPLYPNAEFGNQFYREGSIIRQIPAAAYNKPSGWSVKAPISFTDSMKDRSAAKIFHGPVVEKLDVINTTLKGKNVLSSMVIPSYNHSWYTYGRRNGGSIPSFAYGGYHVVPGFDSTAVPAMLHGGEFIVNSKAVKNIGYATLASLNNMRFREPRHSGSYGTVPIHQSTNTTHIYVDNFIGEEEWFNQMVKQYNMTVLPRNQKNNGLENRVLTTYNGMSRGM